MKIPVQVGHTANMDYLKSSNMEEAKPKLAVSVAQNKSAAAIHSYSTAFYQVSHITLLLNFPTSVSQFLFLFCNLIWTRAAKWCLNTTQFFFFKFIDQ